MANYVTKINEYCKTNGVSNANPLTDYLVRDDKDGRGQYIQDWNLAITKPTDEQLDTFESVGNDAEALEIVRSNRASEFYNNLGNWKSQLDMIYHDIDDWKAKVKEIKDKYPKS